MYVKLIKEFSKSRLPGIWKTHVDGSDTSTPEFDGYNNRWVSFTYP